MKSTTLVNGKRKIQKPEDYMMSNGIIRKQNTKRKMGKVNIELNGKIVEKEEIIKNKDNVHFERPDYIDCDVEYIPKKCQGESEENKIPNENSNEFNDDDCFLQMRSQSNYKENGKYETFDNFESFLNGFGDNIFNQMNSQDIKDQINSKKQK